MHAAPLIDSIRHIHTKSTHPPACPQGANVLDVVHAEVLVLSQAAVQALTARLLP